MRVAIPLLISLLLIGCSVDPRQRIVGNWTVDPAKTQIPKTPFPQAEKQVKSLMSSVSVKFSADGTGFFAGPTPVEGKWIYEVGKVTLTPNDGSLFNKLPMANKNVVFTVDPDFKTMTWEPETPFGKVTLVLNKTG